MTKLEFKDKLETHYDYFIQFNGEASIYEGWKLSIQGRTIEDAVFLYKKLIGLLHSTKCSYKFGTKRLIDFKHPQQSTKLLTIYIPNNVDPKSMAELVRLNLIDYIGAIGIDKPKSYSTYSKELGIYFRNDRDETGNYIPAN